MVNLDKKKYVEEEKFKLRQIISEFEYGRVEDLLFLLTGRRGLKSANIFCLALMVNILRRCAR